MNTATISRGCAIAIIVASTVACNHNDEIPSGYFPLQENLVWKYWVVAKTPHERNESELQITNIGVWEDGNEQYYVRKTNTGNYYYIQERDDGIVRVTKRTIAEYYPRLGMAERYVIKYPLQAGTQWSYNTKPYLLDRPFPTSKEIKRTIDYEMDWEIVGNDETISVPQGEFENCLHIRGRALVDVPRALSVARDEVLFETDEWYAPNVGLIKLVHKEKVDSDQAFGGSITMILTTFDY